MIVACRLTGRELTTSGFDADSVRLIYKPSAKDQRVYMQPRNNGNVTISPSSNGKQRLGNMVSHLNITWQCHHFTIK